MKFIALVMSLILMISFSGCYQEDNIADDLNQEQYSLGLQVFDENDQMLPYAIDIFSEHKVRKVKVFNLMKHDTSFLFLALLNGVPCSIEIDGIISNIYHGVITAETTWEKEVKITLERDSLIIDNNNLVFLVVAENQIIPKNDLDHYLFYSVSFSHHLIDTPKIDTTILFDTTNTLEKSFEIMESFGSSFYLTVEATTNEDHYLSASNFIDLISGQKASIKVKMIGPEGLYAILLFCDDELVPMQNGVPYYHVQLGKNELFSKTFDITPEKQEGSLYAVAIPLTNDSLFSCSSQKVRYIITGKDS